MSLDDQKVFKNNIDINRVEENYKPENKLINIYIFSDIQKYISLQTFRCLNDHHRRYETYQSLCIKKQALITKHMPNTYIPTHILAHINA